MFIPFLVTISLLISTVFIYAALLMSKNASRRGNQAVSLEVAMRTIGDVRPSSSEVKAFEKLDYAK